MLKSKSMRMWPSGKAEGFHPSIAGSNPVIRLPRYANGNSGLWWVYLLATIGVTKSFRETNSNLAL